MLLGNSQMQTELTIAINPGWTIGPPLQPALNLTVEIVLSHINGQTFPNQVFDFVDVRDVANAHILAFERASANGRYCLVAQVADFSEFLKIVHERYPALHLPEKCADDKPFLPKHQVSKEKAKTLGINFTPLVSYS